METYIVPRTPNNFGDRSFAAAKPRVSNNLQFQLRQDTRCREFKRQKQ